MFWNKGLPLNRSGGDCLRTENFFRPVLRLQANSEPKSDQPIPQWPATKDRPTEVRALFANAARPLVAGGPLYEHCTDGTRPPRFPRYANRLEIEAERGQDFRPMRRSIGSDIRPGQTPPDEITGLENGRER